MVCWIFTVLLRDIFQTGGFGFVLDMSEDPVLKTGIL